MITGDKLNKLLGINAAHALYREDGKWYHHLKYFPGVLFDINGFIIFKSQSEYLNNSHLHHGQDLNIYNGISTMPGYQKFTEEEKRKIKLLS